MLLGGMTNVNLRGIGLVSGCPMMTSPSASMFDEPAFVSRERCFPFRDSLSFVFAVLRLGRASGVVLVGGFLGRRLRRGEVDGCPAPEG
jgi:hypothetical protein